MTSLQNDLIRAIRRVDVDALERLKKCLKTKTALGELLIKPGPLGASAYQWALWRQHPVVLAQLGITANSPLLTRKKKGSLIALPPDQVATQFNYRNSHYPCFEEPHRIPRTIRTLRLLFRFSWLEAGVLFLGAVHRHQLEFPKPPRCSVRFVSERVGYGVFAEQQYETGDWVGEYVGVINRRNLMSPPRDTTYIIDYPVPTLPGYRWSMDAREVGNFTRFVNHHDHPNCAMSVAFDGFILRLVLLTRCRINPGQELTIDYGADYWRRRPQPLL